MTTFFGRRITSAVLATVVTMSGPFGVVTTAAAGRASASIHPLPAVAHPAAGAPAALRAREAFGKLPLSFEANHGQTHPDVKFLSRGNGYSLFLSATEAVFVLRPPGGAGSPASVLRMQMVGSSPNPFVKGLEELPGKANYFIGADPTRWRTNVPTYARVAYEGVYPGIDLVYYGHQRELEYDFVVAPGADPGAIKLAFAGATTVTTDARGDLLVATAGGDVRLKKPYVYQLVAGVKRPVAGGYVVRGGDAGAPVVGFRLAAYDQSRPLVIDPVLIYSTYVGALEKEQAESVAVDAAGNAYVVGATNSNDFPATAGMTADYDSNGMDYDIFVAKLDAKGSAYVYVTYIGGEKDEAFAAFTVPRITVDAAGNAYLAGSTLSWASFPVPGGDVAKFGAGGDLDLFVVKLNDMGQLVFSALYGGSGFERQAGIAVDVDGNVYVMGQTNSAVIKTTPNAYDTSYNGDSDVFVAKFAFDAQTSTVSLSYSTYLGGSGQETFFGQTIAVDNAGHVYVAGRTVSVNFPTTATAHDTVHNDGDVLNVSSDVFVAKLKTDVTSCSGVGVNCPESLVYSTYVGGKKSELDTKHARLVLDGANRIYVTGDTLSGNSEFPTTTPAAGTTCPGSFLVIIDAGKTGPESLVYATCGDWKTTGLAVDSPGRTVYFGNKKLDLVSNTLIDYPVMPNVDANGLVVDAACAMYVMGTTGDANFPKTGPLGPADAVLGDTEAFVQKIGEPGPFAYVTNFNAASVSVVDTATHTKFDTGTGNGPKPTIPAPGDIHLGGAYGVAVSPRGNRAYVTDQEGNRVYVIDTDPTSATVHTEIDNLSVAQGPVGIAVTPDGSRIYVTTAGSNAVSVIEVSDATSPPAHTVLPGSIPVGAVPVGVAISPDGKRAYVANQGSNTVSVIDTDPTSGTFHTAIGAPIAVGGDGPTGVAVTPDGARVYVTNAGTTPGFVSSVSVIDAAGPTWLGDIQVGTEPTGIAIVGSPMGARVYVANTSDDTVAAFDDSPVPSSVAPTFIPIGDGPGGSIFRPIGVAAHPDGTRVYVVSAGNAGHSVSVIATRNNMLVDTDLTTMATDAIDLGLGKGPIGFGPFVSLPLDKDGDGIWDAIDGDFDSLTKQLIARSDPSQPGSIGNQTFTNKHLCGSVAGQILSVPDGMAVKVGHPAGIVIAAVRTSASDPNAKAQVRVCDFDVLYDPDDVTLIPACASLIAQVVSGPIEVLLDGAGVVTVPRGTTVRVTRIAAGQFEVRNLGGFAPITVEFQGQVTQVTSGTSGSFPPADSDGDGVANDGDQCAATPAGKAVDANGCSGEQRISQACPCAGPSAGGTWKNHGAYAACVAREADGIARSGLVTHKDKGAIQSQTARSSCGTNGR